MPSRRAAAALVLVVIAASLAGPRIAGRYGFGPIDDAYISLRYAANLAAGEGLVFNPGERVEGYTNFLLIALEAMAIRAGVAPETAMTAIGWLSLALLALVVFLLALRHVWPGRVVESSALALASALNPLAVAWAASGMETILFTGLLLATLLLLLEPGAEMGAGVAGALAAMTRPEAVVLAPVLAAAALLARPAADRMSGYRHPATRFALAFGMLYGAYFAGRWWYYGYLLPNTFYAKLDFGNASLLARGLRYVADFAAAAGPLVVIAGAGVALLWGAQRWVRPAAALAASMVAVVAYEGGDHFAMFRFLAPLLPVLGLLAVVPAARLARRWLREPAPAAAAAACALLVAAGFGIASASVRGERDLRQWQRFALENDYVRNWTRIGLWLRDAAPPATTLATVAIGAIGYHSGLDIIDPHGLVDPDIAHLDVDLGRGTAGHEKFDVDALLAKRPDYLLLVNWMTPVPMPRDELTAEAWGDFNRELLAHPELERDYRYVSVPASGLFLNLHVRAGADTPRDGVGDPGVG